MTASPIDIHKPLWYIINLFPTTHMSDQIQTENEFTTHPKMLELTSNAGKVRYNYCIQYKSPDGLLRQYVYCTAINALSAVISHVRWNEGKTEMEISKIITNRDTLFVDIEKMTSVELQNEAFMESNLSINKAVPFGTA